MENGNHQSERRPRTGPYTKKAQGLKEQGLEVQVMHWIFLADEFDSVGRPKVKLPPMVGYDMFPKIEHEKVHLHYKSNGFGWITEEE